jgi:EAL domain-containing protein (putative c-di-GMP-specific phosphodiesterase class I)
MQVIVEGIETPEQLSLIRKLGANEVQGYLLGKPTPEPAAQLCKKNPVLDFPAQSARN